MCHNGQVEDEEHFLFSCNSFNLLRAKYNFENFTAAQGLFTENNCDLLRTFLTEAFNIRENMIGNLGAGDG